MISMNGEYWHTDIYIWIFIIHNFIGTMAKYNLWITQELNFNLPSKLYTFRLKRIKDTTELVLLT